MKKTLLLFSFITLFFAVHSQQWVSSPLPNGRNINSVAILPPNNILVAGGNEYHDSIESVFYTNTYGLTWTYTVIGNIPSGLSSWLTSVAFKDSVNGYGVGFNGKLIATSNAGNYWKFDTTGFIRNYNKVVYASATTLFAVGGWQDGDTLHPQHTQTILKSTDGGNSWSLVYDTIGPWLTAVYFTDSLHGIAVGQTATILSTINGGNTWTRITPPISRSFGGVTFINADTGYIVGGNDSTRTILQTVNGGNTWSVLRDEPGGYLTDVSFTDRDTGYIVGTYATLFRTVNRGFTWTAQTVSGTGGTEYFTSVKFRNTGLGAIGTLNGRVYLYFNIPKPLAFTVSSTPGDSGATLFGSVNTFGNAGQYQFSYSTDPTFSGAYNQTLAQSITCDSLLIASAQLQNLQPSTTYYYYFSAADPAGTVYGDTLSFFTGVPYSTFQTEAATFVSDTTAELNGLMEQFSSGVNLFFDYGTTPALGHEIVASPTSVNDTGLHQVTAMVHSLLPHTTYYYTLKGVTLGGENFYGGINTFYTGNPFASFQALPATGVLDSAATFNGQIEGLLLNANITFEYGTSPAFGSEAPANPSTLNDTFIHALSLSLNDLQPNTIYYYRLKAQTPVGTFYSNTILLYTGNTYFDFETLGATPVTTTSARLNGQANKFPLQAQLYFDYGITPALGNEVAASPGALNDTLPHTFYANLSALAPHTTYYFQLKGVTASGTFYGGINTLYTGAPFPQAETLQATTTNYGAAGLNGRASGFAVPVALDFEYGTSPNTLNLTTPPGYLGNDTGTALWSSYTGNLDYNAYYYYRLKVSSSIGIFYGATYEFNTDTAFEPVQTLPAANVTLSSAVLNGRVDHFAFPAALNFNYGTTPSLGSVLTANPSLVFDTAAHNVSASLTGLTANTTYYYKLQATGADSLNIGGLIDEFYTGNVYSVLQTMPATMVTDSSVMLNAYFDNFLFAANVGFEYGTTPAFGQENYGNPPQIFTGMQGNTSLFINGLQTNTLYYFRVVAQTSVGTFYGATMQFYTGTLFATLQTLGATNTTTNSVQLNGIVDHLAFSTSLQFQYGTTQSLGSSVAASPGLVNDSGLHQVSAYLGGLTPNTIYYYQLAGLEDSMAVNGGIQQFYVGDCEVPNCDFEAWDSIFDWQPAGWNIIGSVTRVPSYDGSWAVQLTGGNIDQVGGVVLGEPGNGNPGISGGIPFTTRPDSIGFHAKYNIVQGDTAYVFLIFVVNGNYMDMDLFPITGNTNGNWVSVWHAIPYTGSYTPDTLIAGIVSSNVFKNNGNTNANSILTIDKVQFTGTGATLPNYNFELWDTIYVPRLQSWSCNGYNTLVNEPSTDIQQTSHRVSGNYAVRLQTDSINQSSVNLSIYPNPNNGGPTFPLSLHHTTLNFFAEFIPQPQDAFSVMFTEFKQGTQIAGAYGNFDSLMTGYTPISIPINYYNQILIPDSANLSITLGTGNARAGSTLYLDDISFDGFRVSGIQNPGLLQSLRGLLFTLFPNPASESIRVQMLKDDTYTLQIFDTHGVMLTTRTFNGKQSDIDISGLANGTYIARVGEGENAVARKFIIAR